MLKNYFVANLRLIAFSNILSGDSVVLSAEMLSMRLYRGLYMSFVRITRGACTGAWEVFNVLSPSSDI